MKISVLVEHSQEEDGYTGQTLFTRNDIVDLTDLAQFIGTAVNGIGFNYVEDVCFLTEGGTEWWGFKL